MVALGFMKWRGKPLHQVLDQVSVICEGGINQEILEGLVSAPQEQWNGRQREKKRVPRSLARQMAFRPTCHLLFVSFPFKLNRDKHFLRGTRSAKGSWDLLARAACKVCVLEALSY